MEEPSLTILTPKELEILGLLCLGMGYMGIASQLTISETTVKTHVNNLFRKLQVHSNSELVAKNICKLCTKIKGESYNNVVANANTEITIVIRIPTKEIYTVPELEYRIDILRPVLAKLSRWFRDYMANNVKVEVYDVEKTKERIHGRQLAQRCAQSRVPEDGGCILQRSEEHSI